MKKLLIFLPLLFVLGAHADDFGPDDKVLYFSSNVLINVITQTFPENLRLDVANKYVSLIDDKGNVSVSDLISVCETGKLDGTQCRNFIDALITATDKSVKAFYWADLIGKGILTAQRDNSGDGHYTHSKQIAPGEWYVKFDWTESGAGRVWSGMTFQEAYPNSNAIIGTSACTNERGTRYVADDTKNFASNEQSGEYCWCKMVRPEETSWVYFADKEEYENMYIGMKIKEENWCARHCAGACAYEFPAQRIFYGNGPGSRQGNIHNGKDMKTTWQPRLQEAMFTAVKLNKSIANVGEEDDDIEKDLNKEFKPCEFDWGKITEKDLYGKGYWAAAEQHGVYQKGKRDCYSRYWYFGPGVNCSIDACYDDQRHAWSDVYTNCKPNQIKNIQDEFIIHPSFMDTEDFQCKYPGVKYLRGTYACTNDDSGYYGKTITDKQFTPNENSGPFCWCKITSPKESKWVYGSFHAGLPDHNTIADIRNRFNTVSRFYCIEHCGRACAEGHHIDHTLMLKTIK